MSFYLRLTIILMFCLFLVQAVFAQNQIDRKTYGTIYHDITSTQFQLKGGVGDPAVGRSTSTNYIFDHGLVMEFPMMTITVDPVVDFGVVLPEIASLTSSVVYVDMPGSTSGYSLFVKREDINSTLDMTTDSSVDFPDYLAWNNSGSGNATTSPGNTLSFRVRKNGTTSNYDSNWWGLNDIFGNAKYAGFPVVNTTFMYCSTCYWGTTATVLEYRASAPIYQKSGSYDGIITITALANI